MTRRHAFEWISDSSRMRVFVVTALLAIGLLITLQALNAHLRTDAAPSGIISYELAGDVATAEEILESWGPDGRVYAGISLGLDYLFLFTYAIAIGLACVLLADRMSTRASFLSTLGIWLAWGMVAAGAFDFVENYGLIRMLIGEGKPWWPSIVYWCAIFKFILVGIGLAYLVVGFISLRLPRTGGAYTKGAVKMAVIKVIELVGGSSTGWDDAARNALKEAAETIRSIRGLDVLNQTATVKDGAITEYRTNIRISFVVEDVRD